MNKLQLTDLQFLLFQLTSKFIVIGDLVTHDRLKTKFTVKCSENIFTTKSTCNGNQKLFKRLKRFIKCFSYNKFYWLTRRIFDMFTILNRIFRLKGVPEVRIFGRSDIIDLCLCLVSLFVVLISYLISAMFIWGVFSPVIEKLHKNRLLNFCLFKDFLVLCFTLPCRLKYAQSTSFRDAPHSVLLLS